MRRNLHVRFLGEEGRATEPPYPTASDVYQVSRLGIYGASSGGHLALMQGTAGDTGRPYAHRFSPKLYT